MQHPVRFYVKRNILTMKAAGSDQIGMIWRYIKLPALMKQWPNNEAIANSEKFYQIKCCLLVSFTRVAKYLVIAMYLVCLFLKQKSMSSFVACFHLWCVMFIYSVQKSKVVTEEAIDPLTLGVINLTPRCGFSKNIYST